MRVLSFVVGMLACIGGGALAQAQAPAGEAEAHYRSGVALKEQGKIDDAIAQFELAVVARPNHAMAWNSLGILYKKKGENEKAVDAFERAVKLMPKDAVARANLGMAYYRAGR